MDCSKISSDYHLMKHRYENEFLSLYNSFLKNEISDIGGIKKKFDEVAILVKVLSDQLNEWRSTHWSAYNYQYFFDDRALHKYTREVDCFNLRDFDCFHQIVGFSCEQNGDIIVVTAQGELYIIRRDINGKLEVKSDNFPLETYGHFKEDVMSVRYGGVGKLFFQTSIASGFYDYVSREKIIIKDEYRPSFDEFYVLPDDRFVGSRVIARERFMLYEKNKRCYPCIAEDLRTSSINEKKDDLVLSSAFGKDQFLHLYKDGHFEILSLNGEGGYLRQKLELDMKLSGEFLRLQVISSNKILVFGREYRKDSTYRTYLNIISHTSENGKYHVDDVLIPSELMFPDHDARLFFRVKFPKNMHVLPDGRIIIIVDRDLGIGQIQKNQVGVYEFIMDGELIPVSVDVLGFQVVSDGKLAVISSCGKIRFFDDGVS